MNQNPGRQSREMGKSRGRERKFEEVCFEFGTEYWYCGEVLLVK